MLSCQHGLPRVILVWDGWHSWVGNGKLCSRGAAPPGELSVLCGSAVLCGEWVMAREELLSPQTVTLDLLKTWHSSPKSHPCPCPAVTAPQGCPRCLPGALHCLPDNPWLWEGRESWSCCVITREPKRPGRTNGVFRRHRKYSKSCAPEPGVPSAERLSHQLQECTGAVPHHPGSLQKLRVEKQPGVPRGLRAVCTRCGINCADCHGNAAQTGFLPSSWEITGLVRLLCEDLGCGTRSLRMITG